MDQERLLLIKYSADYADEFDVDGFAVWTESKWEEHKKEVAAFFDKKSSARPKPRALPADYNDPSFHEIYSEHIAYDSGLEVERYFGTNEYMIYSGMDDYLACFEVKEITQEENKVLQKLFQFAPDKEAKFGMFLTLREREMEDM